MSCTLTSYSRLHISRNFPKNPVVSPLVFWRLTEFVRLGDEVLVSREKNIAIVESYLACFASKDLSNLPFAEHVVFDGPTWPTLAGREAVLRFLRMILPGIRGARVKQHIVEGDHIATIFDMETEQGIDHVCDCIEIANGEIARVQAFFYPRQPPRGPLG